MWVFAGGGLLSRCSHSLHQNHCHIHSDCFIDISVQLGRSGAAWFLTILAYALDGHGSCPLRALLLPLLGKSHSRQVYFADQEKFDLADKFGPI